MEIPHFKDKQNAVKYATRQGHYTEKSPYEEFKVGQAYYFLKPDGTFTEKLICDELMSDQKKTCKFHSASDKSHSSNHIAEEQAFYRGPVESFRFRSHSLSNYKKGGKKTRRRKHTKKSKRKGRKTRRK